MGDQQADTALIELQGVSRTFAGGDGPVRVLADISLRIDAGEFVCVHGPSGSGKSTLLHILGCLDTPSGGSYRLALAPREASFLESQWMADLSNKWAYVPFASGLTFLFEDKRLDIWARVRPEHIERTARAIQDLLVARHGGLDGFYVRTSSGSLAEWTRMQALLERVWTVAGGILVLLGGFGVMATSWMTARSRRREVAIRMAAGARRRDVLRQFLGEASAVSVAGGVLGVGASLATLLAMARIPAPVVFSPWPALVALACTAALGVAFGILPARRAAGLDPVAALRLEEAT